MKTILQLMHEDGQRVGLGLLRKYHAINPMFFLLWPHRFDAVECNWENQQKKEEHIADLRRTIREDRVVAYTFVTEAWVATVGRHERELMMIPPRERSNREDALIILSRHRNGENYATRYHVEYDKEGRVTLGPGEDLPGEMNEGLMGNLFEEENTREYH
jgi:hypothetical protein